MSELVASARSASFEDYRRLKLAIRVLISIKIREETLTGLGKNGIK